MRRRFTSALLVVAAVALASAVVLADVRTEQKTREAQEPRTVAAAGSRDLRVVFSR